MYIKCHVVCGKYNKVLYMRSVVTWIVFVTACLATFRVNYPYKLGAGLSGFLFKLYVTTSD